MRSSVPRVAMRYSSRPMCPRKATFSMVEATVAAYGRLDVAFNNAGVEQPAKPPAADGGRLPRRHGCQCEKGVWASLRHEIAAMLRTGGGAIVNNASVAGLIGMTWAPVCTPPASTRSSG